MPKLDTTPVIDLAAIALAPALIMGMIGSFVLFTIEVAYRGDYSARLVWTFAFMVFGAVLVARISITESRSRSMAFGIALGAAAFVAMLQFVEYPRGAMGTVGPLLNLVLIGLILFAADRLTWDCTHFDPARKASGRGVLSAAGFDPRDADPDESDDEPVAQGHGWLERYESYRKRRAARPHTPGVTILYFALAALPLFAIGQSLIAVEDASRRRATLFYMAIYIGSALGLLVTTSLMGLRKYLEERGARVPAALTFGWLGLGAGLIVMFLAVGMVLPRPHSETPLVRLGGGKSSEREASRFAPVPDSSAGKGKGAAGRKQEAGGQKPGQVKGDPKGPGGKSAGPQGKGESKQKGDSGADKGDAKSKGDSKDDKGDKGDAKSPDEPPGQEPKSDPEQSEPPNKEQGDPEEGDQSDANDPDNAEPPPDSGPSKVGEIATWAAGLLTWVVRVVVVLAVIAGAVYLALKGLAPFTTWAKGLLDWWRNLFARKEAAGPDVADAAESVAEVRFDELDDPFQDGRAKSLSSADLAGLTFAALEAWARGHGLPRGAGETPREFAARLGNEFATLDPVAYAAAELHDRAGYSATPVQRRELNTFAKLWQVMRADPPR